MYRHNEPRKKFYTDLANILVLISTFAGTVTLGTQYVLTDCKGNRLQALLILASQFFLASPPALFAIYWSLSNFSDNGGIHGTLKRFIVAQFALVATMIIGGLLCINVSLLYFGVKWAGPTSIALTGAIVLTVFAAAIANANFPNTRLPPLNANHQQHYNLCADCGECDHGVPAPMGAIQHRWANNPTSGVFTGTTAILWVCYGLECAALVALSGAGIYQVWRAKSTTCNSL